MFSDITAVTVMWILIETDKHFELCILNKAFAYSTDS